MVNGKSMLGGCTNNLRKLSKLLRLAFSFRMKVNPLVFTDITKANPLPDEQALIVSR